MFNIKVKLRQKLKPARIAPGHSRARLNICQRDMIRQYKELDANKEVAPTLQTLTNRNILAISCRVVALATRKTLRVKLYGVPFARWLPLL